MALQMLCELAGVPNLDIRSPYYCLAPALMEALAQLARDLKSKEEPFFENEQRSEVGFAFENVVSLAITQCQVDFLPLY